MFQFLCRFAFLSTFRLSIRTPKITRILMLCQANAFSKEDKILIKNLYECKGCNAWHFITKFFNKGWTKNSINRLLVKFGTVDRRPGSSSSVRVLMITSTQSSRCCRVRKTKPQSNRTARVISREA